MHRHHPDRPCAGLPLDVHVRRGEPAEEARQARHLELLVGQRLRQERVDGLRRFRAEAGEQAAAAVVADEDALQHLVGAQDVGDAQQVGQHRLGGGVGPRIAQAVQRRPLRPWASAKSPASPVAPSGERSTAARDEVVVGRRGPGQRGDQVAHRHVVRQLQAVGPGKVEAARLAGADDVMEQRLAPLQQDQDVAGLHGAPVGALARRAPAPRSSARWRRRRARPAPPRHRRRRGGRRGRTIRGPHRRPRPARRRARDRPARACSVEEGDVLGRGADAAALREDWRRPARGSRARSGTSAAARGRAAPDRRGRAWRRRCRACASKAVEVGPLEADRSTACGRPPRRGCGRRRGARSGPRRTPPRAAGSPPTDPGEVSCASSTRMWSSPPSSLKSTHCAMSEVDRSCARGRSDRRSRASRAPSCAASTRADEGRAEGVQRLRLGEGVEGGDAGAGVGDPLGQQREEVDQRAVLAVLRRLRPAAGLAGLARPRQADRRQEVEPGVRIGEPRLPEALRSACRTSCRRSLRHRRGTSR